MPRNPVFRVLIAVVAPLLLAKGASASGLYTTYGTNTESTLARIDPETGSVTVIGLVRGANVGMVGGLAYDSLQNVLYGVAWGKETSQSGWMSSLFRIDPATGVAKLVGPTGHAALAGLAYDSKNDVLYGGGGDYPNTYLVRIDRTTGTAIRVGNQIAHTAALEYLPTTDRLVYVDVPFDPPLSTFWEVDRSTGAGTLIGPTGVGGIYGTAYDPNTGRLYALPGSLTGASGGRGLFTLDAQTGHATRYRTLTLGAGYNSMTYVPEPGAAIAAALLGAATVGRRARRRS